MVHSSKKTSFNRWNIKVKNSLYAKNPTGCWKPDLSSELRNFDKLQIMQLILLIHDFFHTNQ